MRCLKVTITCPSCGLPYYLTVPKEGYVKWQSGTLIQNALPELSSWDRESLITGLCFNCQDKIFTEPEE